MERPLPLSAEGRRWTKREREREREVLEYPACARARAESTDGVREHTLRVWHTGVLVVTAGSVRSMSRQSRGGARTGGRGAQAVLMRAHSGGFYRYSTKVPSSLAYPSPHAYRLGTRYLPVPVHLWAGR